MLNARFITLLAAVLLVFSATAAPCKPCNNGPRRQFDILGSIPKLPVPTDSVGGFTTHGSPLESVGGSGTSDKNDKEPHKAVHGEPVGNHDDSSSSSGSSSSGSSSSESSSSGSSSNGSSSSSPLGFLESHLEDLSDVAQGKKDPLRTMVDSAKDFGDIAKGGIDAAAHAAPEGVKGGIDTAAHAAEDAVSEGVKLGMAPAGVAGSMASTLENANSHGGEHKSKDDEGGAAGNDGKN